MSRPAKYRVTRAAIFNDHGTVRRFTAGQELDANRERPATIQAGLRAGWLEAPAAKTEPAPKQADDGPHAVDARAVDAAPENKAHDRAPKNRAK